MIQILDAFVEGLVAFSKTVLKLVVLLHHKRRPIDTQCHQPELRSPIIKPLPQPGFIIALPCEVLIRCSGPSN